MLHKFTSIWYTISWRTRCARWCWLRWHTISWRTRWTQCWWWRL